MITTNIDFVLREDTQNLFSLAVTLIAAAEIALSHSHEHIKEHLRQRDIPLPHESKRAINNLLKSMESVRYWSDRLQEKVVGQDKDSMQLFDTIHFHSNHLLQVAMMYTDITSHYNTNIQKDADMMFSTLMNLSLKAGAKPFSQEYINLFEPKL